MDKPSNVLVCFAVKEEAAAFLKTGAAKRCSTLITGMGRNNAGAAIRRALTQGGAGLVVTAGFAGGLNPKLPTGTIVFEADSETRLAEKLSAAGCVAARFHCASRVAVTAAEKAELWRQTGADAVEMESEVIRAFCRERVIPSATVRVISDPANEDLPLDFNALMTPDERIDYAKLAWTVASAPGKIGKLLRFQKQTAMAAGKLAEALEQSLTDASGK